MNRLTEFETDVLRIVAAPGAVTPNPTARWHHAIEVLSNRDYIDQGMLTDRGRKYLAEVDPLNADKYAKYSTWAITQVAGEPTVLTGYCNGLTVWRLPMEGVTLRALIRQLAAHL